MTGQLAIDELYPCPACKGTGERPNLETGGVRPCRVCEGCGTVPYDPDDNEIPY